MLATIYIYRVKRFKCVLESYTEIVSLCSITLPSPTIYLCIEEIFINALKVTITSRISPIKNFRVVLI